MNIIGCIINFTIINYFLERNERYEKVYSETRKIFHIYSTCCCDFYPTKLV
jgi:hypothetical protein